MEEPEEGEEGGRVEGKETVRMTGQKEHRQQHWISTRTSEKYCSLHRH